MSFLRKQESRSSWNRWIPVFTGMTKCVFPGQPGFTMRKFFLFFSFLFFLVSPLQSKEKEFHIVTKVIDGATLEVDGKETIRLIGVSVPDPNSENPAKKKWGQQILQLTKQLVGNRQVWLEYGSEKKTDEQGKTWAYVFFNMKLKEVSRIMDDAYMPFWGTGGNFMLNRMLVEFGYAYVSSPFSFKYRSTFTGLEKDARRRDLGMWSDLK